VELTSELSPTPSIAAYSCINNKFMLAAIKRAARGNSNPKSQKYLCITTYQPDTKSNPYPNPNPNSTTTQHAIVNIRLNIVTCPAYPDKFIRDNVVALSVRL